MAQVVVCFCTLPVQFWAPSARNPCLLGPYEGPLIFGNSHVEFMKGDSDCTTIATDARCMWICPCADHAGTSLWSTCWEKAPIRKKQAVDSLG